MPDGNKIDEFTGRPELQKRRVRALLIQRAFIATLIIYLVSTMAILIVLGYQSQEQRHRLIDCTTPGGRCYQDAQERTGEAIAELVKSDGDTRDLIVAAVACGQNPLNDTKEDILACVREMRKGG